MLRNFAYGGLALVGGAITGIVLSSWATPLGPPPVAPTVAPVVSVAQPAMALASTASRASTEADNCSPWDVSDVAMEAALNEMIRRGWRPPTQAEAIEATQPADGRGASPVEPDAAVPVRYSAVPGDSSEPRVVAPAPFPIGEIEPSAAEPSVPDLPVVAPPATRPAQTPLVTSEAPEPVPN